MLCYAMLREGGTHALEPPAHGAPAAPHGGTRRTSPYLSHPAPTTLLWTYPGIRGQRARPIFCLIASSLVFI